MWTARTCCRASTRPAREAFRLSFNGTPVADAPGDEQQFAFAVPLRLIHGSLARLQLDRRGQRALQTTTGARTAGRSANLRAEHSGTSVTVRWNADDYPLAVIRDVTTGQIRSLASGGTVTLDDTAGALDVTLSDRARSQTERIR